MTSILLINHKRINYLLNSLCLYSNHILRKPLPNAIKK